MKYPRLFTIIFCFTCCISSYAQDGGQIITELEKNVSGQGTIQIYADPEINNLIGKTNDNDDNNKTTTYVKMHGKRIQIFSGNDPKTSKNEALQKEQLIKSAFPTLRTSVTYTAPFWRVRVGDFRTKEEADTFMRQIAQQYPDLAKEMYIVSDEVRIAE